MVRIQPRRHGSMLLRSPGKSSPVQYALKGMVELRRLLARRRLNAGFFCQARKGLVVSFSAIAFHDRTQRGVGSQSGSADGGAVGFEQPFIGGHSPHSPEDLRRVSRSTNRCAREIVVWWRVSRPARQCRALNQYVRNIRAAAAGSKWPPAVPVVLLSNRHGRIPARRSVEIPFFLHVSAGQKELRPTAGSALQLLGRRPQLLAIRAWCDLI